MSRRRGLEALTDSELSHFYECTFDGSPGCVGGKFWKNAAFAAEIDRRAERILTEAD
jgi:hypothetical protein